MWKLVDTATGTPVGEGDKVCKGGVDWYVHRMSKVPGFKSITLQTLSGKQLQTDTDELGLEWREFPDVPLAAIVERQLSGGVILHGPFDDEDAACQWAHDKMAHDRWYCAPIHKPTTE